MSSEHFYALVRSWLSVHLPRARRLSSHTIRSYKTALKTLLAYLHHTRHLSLDQISFEVIDRATITGFTTWLTDAGLSPATVNQRLAAIRSFLSYCAAEDPALVAIWLDINHIRPVRAPTPPRQELSIPAIDALIRAPEQDTRRGLRDTTMILLLFDTAARIQELLDLTVADITTRTGRATVTVTGKGHKTRTIPIMDKTARHLDQYTAVFHPGTPGPDTLLFFTIRGGRHQPMSQDNLTLLLNKHAAAARAGCPELPERIHAHQLRHARAMQMLRAGVPLPHIKEFLGHANIATTSIYATADNPIVRDAIQKAASTTPELAPLWKGDDDTLLRLAGLT